MNKENYLNQARILRTKKFTRASVVSPTVDGGVVSYGTPIPKTKEQLRLFKSKSLPIAPNAASKPVVQAPSPPPPLNTPTVKIMKGCGGCSRKLGVVK